MSNKYLAYIVSLLAAVSLSACDDDAGKSTHGADPGVDNCEVLGDDGECVHDDGPSCPPGQKADENGDCVDGSPCAATSCDPGTTCVAVNSRGKCVDDACVVNGELKQCPDSGKVCGAGGECVWEACLEADCRQGKVCGENGVCGFESAPALVVGPPSGTETSETGTSVTVPVKLNNEPGAPVTLECTITTGSPNPEASADYSGVSFDGSSWDAFQNITVTGLPDAVIDADAAYSLS